MCRLLLILGLSALSACTSAADMADYDHHARYATQVNLGAATATVVRPLSVTDRAVLRDLADEHARRGAGPVSVDTDDAVFAAEIAAALDLDVQHRPGDPGKAVVRVPVWIARVPECGQWAEGVNPDWRNQNTWNFGCAVERNLGLMVANPNDLRQARPSSGRDANRAVDVLGKYGAGRATASQAEQAPTGGVSAVGKSQ